MTTNTCMHFAGALFMGGHMKIKALIECAGKLENRRWNNMIDDGIHHTHRRGTSDFGDSGRLVGGSFRLWDSSESFAGNLPPKC